MTTLDKTTREAMIKAAEELILDKAALGLSPGTDELVDAVIDALSALPAQPVAVKPLDWQKRNGRDEWFADCVVGRYEVGDVRLRVAAVLRHVTGNDADDDTVGRFDTFDLAKAGAQADYEARIRSALAAPFQQEGVTEEMVEVAGAVIEKEVGVFADMSPSFYPWLARQALEAALVDRDRMQPHA